MGACGVVCGPARRRCSRAQRPVPAPLVCPSSRPSARPGIGCLTTRPGIPSRPREYVFACCALLCSPALLVACLISCNASVLLSLRRRDGDGLPSHLHGFWPMHQELLASVPLPVGPRAGESGPRAGAGIHASLVASQRPAGSAAQSRTAVRTGAACEAAARVLPADVRPGWGGARRQAGGERRERGAAARRRQRRRPAGE